MNNNNKKNKLFNIVAYVVLALILLSFVFSSVALVRSYADESPMYTYDEWSDSDSNTTNFYIDSVYFGYTRPSGTTLSVRGYDSSNNLVSGVFTVYLNGTTVFIVYNGIRETRNSQKFLNTDFYYINPLDFQFFRDIENLSYLRYSVVSDRGNTFYKISLVDSSPGDSSPVVNVPNDNYNVYSLFSGAIATYTLDTTIQGSIAMSYSAPVDIDIDSNRVYFHTLFDKIPYAVKHHSFVVDSKLTGFDYLSISIPFNGDINVFKFNFGFSPFIIGSSYPNLVTFQQRGSDTLNSFVKNYYGNLSLYSGDTFHSDFSTSSIGNWEGLLISGVFPDDHLSNVNSVNIQSVISVLDSMFFTYGSNYGLGYKTGFEDAKSQFNSNFDNAYNLGFENGKTVGIAQSNDYSFLSLIGAVVDAPVKAFTSLLNFNFLGINLLVFVTGLLTVVLIIWFIKKLIGGK